MTKPQTAAKQQLELRLLSDLKAGGSTGPRADTAEKASRSTRTGLPLPSASEKDRAVYERISNNYFSSIRKA